MWRRQKKTDDMTPMSDAPISDATIAGHMESLAQAFVRSCAADGCTFRWDAESVGNLDGFCQAFLASDPTQSMLDSMITGMGAYLGEVVVRNGGGQWTYHPGQPPAIREAHSRRRLYFPHNKVAKRLTVGPEHSLRLFYEAVMTGETLPGTVITPRDPS
jgi:hypothetical protein